MRVKKSAELDALLAASAARAKGKKKPASKQPLQPVPAPVPAPPPPQRILGLDTALRKTGWGLIDSNGQHFTAVDCGVISSLPKASLSDCLRRLNGAIKELITRYHPDIAIIEGGFYCKNVRTAIILGTARGAVLGVLSEAELPTYEYAPRKVKQVVCGFGNASKQQVALLVSQFLNIQVVNLPDDATDALALALCHAQLAGIAQGLNLENPL
ncbi:MAG: crossover junction endodeoxyribonuclease RuvC [Lentisphaeria bacterium]|jgi:crossover junction endodeoxyribonuclease RuvC|nr:crossover junction endodeoxyribonuclease RuvC [Lentisphaeria bacterium]MDY0176253.1 crossover junction endodeoxyribonuclease RuvC [Lentisphaeria bacterium]